VSGSAAGTGSSSRLGTRMPTSPGRSRAAMCAARPSRATTPGDHFRMREVLGGGGPNALPKPAFPYVNDYAMFWRDRGSCGRGLGADRTCCLNPSTAHKIQKTRMTLSWRHPRRLCRFGLA
jgi:hypothetical protein